MAHFARVENGIVKEEKKYYPGNPDNYKYFTPIKVRFTEPNATVSVSATCRQADCLLNPLEGPCNLPDLEGITTYEESTWNELGYLTNGNGSDCENATASGSATANLSGGIPTVSGSLTPGGVIMVYALIPIEQSLWTDTLGCYAKTAY